MTKFVKEHYKILLRFLKNHSEVFLQPVRNVRKFLKVLGLLLITNVDNT